MSIDTLLDTYAGATFSVAPLPRHLTARTPVAVPSAGHQRSSPASRLSESPGAGPFPTAYNRPAGAAILFCIEPGRRLSGASPTSVILSRHAEVHTDVCRAGQHLARRVRRPAVHGRPRRRRAERCTVSPACVEPDRPSLPSLDEATDTGPPVGYHAWDPDAAVLQSEVLCSNWPSVGQRLRKLVHVFE